MFSVVAGMFRSCGETRQPLNGRELWRNLSRNGWETANCGASPAVRLVVRVEVVPLRLWLGTRRGRHRCTQRIHLALTGFALLGTPEIGLVPPAMLTSPWPDKPLQAGRYQANAPNADGQHRQQQVQFPVETRLEKWLKVPTAGAIGSNAAAGHELNMTDSSGGTNSEYPPFIDHFIANLTPSG